MKIRADSPLSVSKVLAALFLASVLLLLVALPAGAEESTVQDSAWVAGDSTIAAADSVGTVRTMSNASRITGQVIGGIVFVPFGLVVGGIAGGIVGSAFSTSEYDWVSPYLGACIGGTAGIVAVSAFGVYNSRKAQNKWMKPTSIPINASTPVQAERQNNISFKRALLGAATGFSVSVALAAITQNARFLYLATVFPTVGAVIASDTAPE